MTKIQEDFLEDLRNDEEFRQAVLEILFRDLSLDSYGNNFDGNNIELSHYGLDSRILSQVTLPID